MHDADALRSPFITTAAEADLLARSLLIAKRAVLADIETEGVLVALDEPGHWYDIRPLQDPREHCAEVLDMFAQALAFAVDAGVVKQHSQLPHLVRVNREPS